MSRNVIRSALLAALVLLAGCTGGMTGGTGVSTTDSTETVTTTAASEQTETADASERGRVNFYVSDERNAISQFERLEVTVTKVGLARATSSAGSDATAATNGTDATAAGTGTASANGTAATPNTSAEEWTTYDVENRTVDLTELRGANATKLSTFEVPNGSYEAVSLSISDVDATLKSGAEADVKLPSERLRLNSQFVVGADESVDFVFDVTAFEAGNSGRYVLKPVVSESGTDVPIEDVDEKDDDEKDDERGESDDLNAAFVGNVTAGANAGVEVTQNGSAVENATLSVDGEVVARTDANGTAAVPVPADAEEFEVEVRADDDEVELSRELTGESAEDDALEVELEDENVTDGEATVVVTREGDPVGNATVEVDGEVAGQTDADGRLDVAVSAGAEVTITVRTDGATATVELDVESE